MNGRLVGGLAAVAAGVLVVVATAVLLVPGGDGEPDPDDERWRRVADGEVDVRELTAGDGSAHCDWQDAYFVYVDVGPSATSLAYARDPDDTLPSDMLTSAYRADATLPDDARDTGYRLTGLDWELYLAADSQRAYVRTPDGVEAWPQVAPFWGCD